MHMHARYVFSARLADPTRPDPTRPDRSTAATTHETAPLHWLAARRVLAARARRDCSRRPEDHAPACCVPMLTGISTATEKYLGADASAHSSSQYCSAAVRQRMPQRGLTHRPRLPQTPDHRLLLTAPWHEVEVVVLQHHDQHSALSGTQRLRQPRAVHGRHRCPDCSKEAPLALRPKTNLSQTVSFSSSDKNRSGTAPLPGTPP